MSIASNFPAIKPTLLLDFANTEELDPRITFTRASTATYFDQFGVMQTAASGVARFDHNPTTFESLGLEIEEQRANLLTYSEQFDNAAWTKSNSSVSANATVSPDGTTNADRLIPSVAATDGRISQSFTGSIGATYTLTAYGKADTFSNFRLYSDDGASNSASVSYNLATGAITTAVGSTGTWTNASSTITPVGNGWYRASLTWTAAITAPTRVVIWCRDTGNGYSGIFIWGAQLEAGAFPTSYIQTVASQVTRAADAASMTGTNFSSWYSQGEGTLYQEYSAIGVSALDRVSVRISDGGAAFTNEISFRNFNGNGTSYQVFVAGVGQLSGMTFTPVLTAGSPNLMAAVYKFNDFAGAKNGGAVQTDTSGILPVVNQLSFPSNGCNTIKKFVYYPLRVTNAQLQGLTS